MCLGSWKSAVCGTADRLTDAPQPAGTHLLPRVYFKRTVEERESQRGTSRCKSGSGEERAMTQNQKQNES